MKKVIGSAAVMAATVYGQYGNPSYSTGEQQRHFGRHYTDTYSEYDHGLMMEHQRQGEGHKPYWKSETDDYD